MVVISSGYTTMNCARQPPPRRRNVAIAYRRTRSEGSSSMKAQRTEREGVRIEFLVSPVELLGENGRLTGVKSSATSWAADASGRRSPVPIPGSSSSSRPTRSHARPSTQPRPHDAPGRGDVKIDRGPGQGRARRPYTTNVRRSSPAATTCRPTTLIKAAGRQEVRVRDRPLPERHQDVGRSPQHEDREPWRHDMPAVRRPAPPAPSRWRRSRSACRRPIQRVNFTSRSSRLHGHQGRSPSRPATSCPTSTSGSTRSAASSPVPAPMSARGRHPHGQHRPAQGRRSPPRSRRPTAGAIARR